MFNTPFLFPPPQLSCPQECGSQHAVQQRALWSLELYFYLILFNYYLHEQVGLRERQPSYPSHRDPMGRALERNCVCALVPEKGWEGRTGPGEYFHPCPHFPSPLPTQT